MSDSQSEYETRESMLKLLSNPELVDLNSAQTAAGLVHGDEFLDLGSLGRGVQRDVGTAPAPGYVLARKALREATWSHLLAIVDREYPRLMKPGAVK